jgi:N-glycosylase/DNA lyase
MQKSYRHIGELREQFEQKKQAIRNRLNDFRRVERNEYFYELAYCLLTPQSSAANAGRAVEVLKSVDFHVCEVDASVILANRSHYIRFHNTKARHLSQAKTMFPVIMDILSNGMTSVELRRWLVRNVVGLGWKEASHFLRNIGHRNLAILDRHILKNLKKHGVIRTLPKTLTPRTYLAIERKFERFATSVGMTMDELDLLFWSRETGQILK